MDSELSSANMADVEMDEVQEAADDSVEMAEEPCSLSVTNVPDVVYEDQEIKAQFEQMFSAFGTDLMFTYLRSFHRVRVTYASVEQADQAKRMLHGIEFEDSEIGVYFVQRQTSLTKDSNLMPPPLTKQFLISPPASPPVGWEQSRESHPVINYDLLSAIAALDTSQPHELHPVTHIAPSIVVHLCEDENSEKDENGKFHPLKSLPRETVQTRRPQAGP